MKPLTVAPQRPDCLPSPHRKISVSTASDSWDEAPKRTGARAHLDVRYTKGDLAGEDLGRKGFKQTLRVACAPPATNFAQMTTALLALTCHTHYARRTQYAERKRPMR